MTAGGACFTPYSSERGPSPRWPPCATVPTSAFNTFGCTGLSAPASVSDAPATWGREQGIRVIDWGCPLMFEPTADPGHIVKPV